MDSVRENAHAPPVHNPVDVNDLLGRCLGRLDLAERILQKFQCALEKDVRELEEAVRTTNTAEIAQLAHRIKGASLAVSAYKLIDCAQSIEKSAAASRMDEIPIYFARLKEESSRIDDFCFTVTADSPSC